MDSFDYVPLVLVVALAPLTALGRWLHARSERARAAIETSASLATSAR